MIVSYPHSLTLLSFSSPPHRHKDSDICFDLLYPHFTDPNKRNITSVFHRLQQLSIISQDHPRPKELVLEEEEDEEDEEDDDDDDDDESEEEDVMLNLDDDNNDDNENGEKEEIKKEDLDPELIDIVTALLKKNFASSLTLLKKEIQTTINLRTTIDSMDDNNNNTDDAAATNNFQDYLIIPVADIDIEQFGHEIISKLLLHLKFTNRMPDGKQSWWRIPKDWTSKQLEHIQRKIEVAEKKAKQRIEHQQKMKEYLNEKNNKTNKNKKSANNNNNNKKNNKEASSEKEKEKEQPKKKKTTQKRQKVSTAQPEEEEQVEKEKEPSSSKQHQKNNKPKDVVENKRKEALESMKERLHDIKKRKRYSREDAPITSEVVNGSPKKSRIRRSADNDGSVIDDVCNFLPSCMCIRTVVLFVWIYAYGIRRNTSLISSSLSLSLSPPFPSIPCTGTWAERRRGTSRPQIQKS